MKTITMWNVNKFLLTTLFSFMFLGMAMAQSTNSSQSSCVDLSNNMKYRMRDANTNGEVSNLQIFLNTKGYLDSEPTGFFGVSTLKAVKSFQSSIGLTSAGYVGSLTRDKIYEMSCGVSSSNVTSDNTVSSPVVTQTSDTNTVSTNPIISNTETATTFTKPLYQGMTDTEVTKLQKILNMNPDTQIASSGPGSPGMETGFFGLATQKAVQRFQDKYNLATPAQKATANYGAVGPKTGEMLLRVFSDNQTVAQATNITRSTENNTVVLNTISNKNLATSITFTATPSNITYGQSATLLWSSSNATSCTASGGWTGDKSTNGIESISPTTSQTYKLSCTGTGGSADSSVSVTVGAQSLSNNDTDITTVSSPVTPIVTFTANPTSITPGQSAILYWNSNNASFCNASGGWTGNQEITGTHIVSPATAQTYKLSCTGLGGTIIKSVSVNVGLTTAVTNTNQSTLAPIVDSVAPITVIAPIIPAPTVILNSNIASVTSGQSATLTWSSTDATSCTASGGWIGALATNGTQSVLPTSAQSYTLSCTGTGGTTSQSVNVAVTAPVTPAPIVTLTTSAVSITSGQSATLTWSSTNSTSCTATGGWAGNLSTNGTQTVSPTSAQTYNLSCTGAGGTISKSVNISLTAPVTPAPTVTLTSSATSITSGQSATLTWLSTNATSCTASGGWTGALATSGTQSASPTSAQTYTLSCTGAGGNVSQSVNVAVTAPVTPAPTVVLTSNATTITSGQSATLTWSSTNATSCTASGGWTGALATSGTQATSPTSAQTYTLSCTGAGGNVSKSVNVSVTYLAPVVTLTANPTSITSGQSATLAWSSTNATSCTASGGWIGTQSTNGTQSVSPTSAQTYTLSCTGAGGTVSQSANVSITAPVTQSSNTGISSYPASDTNPSGIVSDPVTGSVWVVNQYSSTVSKVNVNTGTKVDYAVGAYPGGIAFDPVTNSVWVTSNSSSTVSKVNINTGTRVDYPNDKQPGAIAFDPVTNSVWTANMALSPYTISKININTGTKVDYSMGAQSAGIAFDPVTNSIWVTHPSTNNVSKVNVNTGTRVDYSASAWPWSITFDSVTNSMWIGGGTAAAPLVSKINVSNGARVDYSVTSSGVVTFDPITSSIWIGAAGANTVIKRNVNTGASVNYFIGSSPRGSAFDPVTNSVWATGGQSYSFSSGIWTPSSITKIGVNATPTTNFPTLTLTVDKTYLTANARDSINLSWSSTNMTSCTASNSAPTISISSIADQWKGTKATSGTQAFIPSIGYTTPINFVLTCTGGTGGGVSLMKVVTVDIRSITIVIPVGIGF